MMHCAKWHWFVSHAKKKSIVFHVKEKAMQHQVCNTANIGEVRSAAGGGFWVLIQTDELKVQLYLICLYT